MEKKRGAAGTWGKNNAEAPQAQFVFYIFFFIYFFDFISKNNLAKFWKMWDFLGFLFLLWFPLEKCLFPLRPWRADVDGLVWGGSQTNPTEATAS